ncbi:MAG: hypothetical protein QM781_13295 [Chitinophagaceae bacterium]
MSAQVNGKGISIYPNPVVDYFQLTWTNMKQNNCILSIPDNHQAAGILQVAGRRIHKPLADCGQIDEKPVLRGSAGCRKPDT